MKLTTSKITVFLLGAALLCPTITFAEEASVNIESNVEGSATVQTKIKAEAKTSSTTKKDNIRERLDEIKAKAKEQKDALKVEADTKRETLKNELEEKREEVKDEMKERRDGARDKAVENIKNRLSKFIDKLIERFSAAISRLEKLADRIASRIVKMEAEGIDVSKAKSLLSEARVKIEVAASSTAAIKVKALEFQSSDTATTTADLRLNYEAVKDAVEQAKSDIKAAHAALVDVVNNLKPGRNKIDTEATTTATSTATTTVN